MIYRLFPLVLFFFSSFTPTITKPSENKIIATVSEKSEFEMKVENVYSHLDQNNCGLPNMATFSKAMEGFYALKANGKVVKDMITIIDFGMSSNTKRLWIIDLATNKVLYNSLVAHGRNTGDEFANSFSNAAESNKSSLGFYATGELYQGKHGLSLKLDGLEKGMNDNARNRAVVMHGADYVCESFIKANHRLGRSLGCPAIPMGMTKEIVNTIKGKSCLFIYHPSRYGKTAAV